MNDDYEECRLLGCDVETSALTRATWHHILEDCILCGKLCICFSAEIKLNTFQTLASDVTA
jgi:hypothetical protein